MSQIDTDEIDDEGILRLRNEVVLQAVRDYRYALLKRNGIEIERLERYFRSEGFKVICDIDPEEIIKECRENPTAIINRRLDDLMEV